MNTKIKVSATERRKIRYLIIEAESKEAIEKAIIEAIGAIGWARAQPEFVELKREKAGERGFVLAVERASVNEVKASFELSKEKIKVLNVSGTLKGLVDNRRGNLELSFNMIFSIILIIAILGAAFYVLSFFFNINKCTNNGLFYKDLQTEIDKAWNADFAEDTISLSLPGSSDFVCFGNVSLGAEPGITKQYDEIKFYGTRGNNLYIYPIKSACNKDLSSYNLKHVQSSKMFCAPVKEGKRFLAVLMFISVTARKTNALKNPHWALEVRWVEIQAQILAQRRPKI